MPRHRFADLMHSESPANTVVATANRGAFMMCPAGLRPATLAELLVWQQVFERAYREAEAVCRPSRVERLQEVCVN